MNGLATSTTAAAPGGTRSLVLTFGVAIFLGAFLLFQVQPIIARFILPWFGGTTDVWTTCLLYFQTMLLIGYAYAHLIAVYLRPRAQVIVHLVLVAAAVAVLPITPSETWQPPDSSWPILRILAILAVCTGLPFMVLAATSPLMQSWFVRTAKGRSPYRFYAVSNAGSLLALVSYPFVFEPLLGLRTQILAWSHHESHGHKFYLFEDKEGGTVEVIGKDAMPRNGHCTYLPGNEWILNDTYPDRQRLQHPYLYHVATGRRVPLGHFHQPPEIHHGHPVGQVAHHAQVVRDEQVGEAELLAQVLQKVDDLRLDGDVERGNRLVADDELRA
ncbi:hypothetical protein LCGC14_0182020, partial [marine sediment metagenome]